MSKEPKGRPKAGAGEKPKPPWLLAVLMNEWPTVKGAPVSFVIAVLASSALLFLGVYWLLNNHYAGAAAQKDATIENLSTKLSGEQKENERLRAKPPESKELSALPTTSIASNNLNQSPVLVGNTASNITINYIVNVTKDEQQRAIEKIAEKDKAELEMQYPGGYVLFGKTEGTVVSKIGKGVTTWFADWDKTEILHDVRRRLIQVGVFSAAVEIQGSHITVGKITAVVPFAEGKPQPLPTYYLFG